jgi:hypothetical protein
MMSLRFVIGAFVAEAIWKGRIVLRNRPVRRADEPGRFWAAVIGFGVIAGFVIAIRMNCQFQTDPLQPDP